MSDKPHVHILRETSQYVLNAIVPAEELRQVDRYIALFNKNPARFVLPRVHEALLPLIAAFYASPEDFMRFVERVRAQLFHTEGATTRYNQVQAFMRELDIRQSQVERRARRRAVSQKLQQHFPLLTATERKDLCRTAEKWWTERRAFIIKSMRQAHGGVLPLERRNEILVEFWEDVWDGINGEVVHVPHDGHLAEMDRPFWTRMIEEITTNY